MTMVDFRGAPGPYQLPHRKPVPPHASVNHSDLQTITTTTPDVGIARQQPQSAVSYSAFPPRQASRLPPATSPSSQSQPFQHPSYQSRRTASQSTASTTNTGIVPTRTPSTVSSQISRTSSTRSGASATPSSYVALMRKQKATVWCDKAQHEDPRIVAQQKAAKIRAAREIHSVSLEGRTSTSNSMGSSTLGVRSKIRHHGLPKATGYSANLVGGGVPMRLSANEVGDEGTYNRAADNSGHQRTDSAKSAGSGGRYLGLDPKQPNRYSQGSIPTVQGGSPESGDIPELGETPVPGDPGTSGGYFAPKSGNGGSGSSSERESSFGAVGQMQAPKVKKRTSEELRRRGSVDERSNTMGYMGSGRLFVANPDLSD